MPKHEFGCIAEPNNTYAYIGKETDCTCKPKYSDLTWHQKEGLNRALGIHKWIAQDESLECLRCGLVIDESEDDYPKCNPE